MTNLIDQAVLAERASAHALTARLDFADAARALLDDFSVSPVDDATVEEAAALVRAASRLLGRVPKNPGLVRRLEGALTGMGELSELGPFTGSLHAPAPLFKLVLNGDRAEAYATYGHAHEGAPGLLQGGFIAATFDELLGVVQSGVIRLTVDLRITYRAPTPLHKELRYTTWLDRIEGRKAYASGTLHEGDRLCAEAQGIFVQPRQLPF